MNCKAVYEGQKLSDPDKRVFILTRSAFAGQQRYGSATWSGDIAARWSDFKAQVPAGLNFSLSGIPYWTTDIGGFAVEPRFEKPSESDLDEWRELNVRWFQFGTFCPLLRVHGQFPYREMWNIAPEGHPAYNVLLEYDKLRYSLLPYIYSLSAMVTRSHYTIMRPLIMDFHGDKNVTNIGDQYMFGPSLLINPVTEYKARSRKLYLPAGTGWYDLKTGKYFEGGNEIIADAPYSDIPVYVKAGSIIPVGPVLQYTSEPNQEPVKLYVYTGKDAGFTLYEDEGINNNYEKGEYSTIEFSYNEKDKALSIGSRSGSFTGMSLNRKFEIIWVDSLSGKGLMSEVNEVIDYDGTSKSIRMK
jgi:alpha-D-xyloside xylohydrolase